MPTGFIYIMTNPALKDMVKIGYSTDVEKRRKDLSTTALPYEYEIYATYETQGKLEDKKLHRLIDDLNPDLRVSANREFFIMSPEDAYKLLETIAYISGSEDKLVKYKKESEKSQKVKRLPINFAKCGIPIGAKLKYIEDPSIEVTVCSKRKVLYNDEEMSLSALVKQLKNTEHQIQGPVYFEYEGRLLTEIAEEKMSLY